MTKAAIHQPLVCHCGLQMAKMRSLACCAAILCLWGSVRAQDNSDMQDVFDRITTEIIRGTYTARVEVTRLKDTGTNKTEEKTYTMVEYHDSSTGLHSLEMTSLNIRKFFYQKLASGTVATVDAGNKCNVQKVEDAAQEPESFIFKSNHAIDPEYFLGPSTVLVQVASDLMNWTAVPDEQVRGINALRYSNYGRKDADKKSIDIWFADDWKINKLSANDVPFPLRIWIEENNVTDQFDFYQVQDLSPKEVFRLGSNLQLPFESESCAFPEPGIEPASLLRTFSFSSSDGSVSAKEYFSKDDNLYRADVAGSTVIHDDEHGLIYKLGKGCKVEPNPAVNPKVLSTGSFNPGARLVQAYLSLPKKMYIGEGFVRGIPVDIWDVVGPNEGAALKKARFFFAKPAAVLSANGDEGSQPLVKAMVLDSLEHDEVLDVDVYDFASSMDDQDFKKNFIIEDCVEASTFIEIGFRATTSFNEEEFKLSNAMKELIQAVGARIRETTGVSALQLPSIKAEVKDGSDITVLVKILAPPPYLKSFAEPRGPFKHYEGSPRDSPDTEDCARECIQKGCKTFLTCGPKCQLMTDSDSSKWGKEITGSAQDCYAYDHVPTTDTMTRPSLDKISFLLENSVMWLWEPFKVSMSQNRSVSLQASTFFDHLTQFNKQGSLGPYKLQFSGLSINPDDASATLVEKIPTVGQCYQQCKTNKDMACSSFSLCPTTQRCVLTSKNINAGTEHDVGQNETLQKATQDCQILSMNYLSEFDRLDGKTRKSGSLANTKATTAGDCAVKCRQSTLEAIETCRSFDFCPKRGTCYYYRTHYGWDGKDDALVNDGDCDHYALRYSASFSAVAKGVFTGKPATIVSSVSFEECAKQCSERSNEECKTISYCDSNVPDKDKMTCYMYALNVEDLFDSTNRESSCTVYTKDEAIVDEIINPRRAIEKEITDHRIGMGNGAFAFLLIAMLAVGAVLGVSGWLQRERITSFIGRSGGSSASGTTISYNRQDNENTGGEA